MLILVVIGERWNLETLTMAAIGVFKTSSTGLVETPAFAKLFFAVSISV